MSAEGTSGAMSSFMGRGTIISVTAIMSTIFYTLWRSWTAERTVKTGHKRKMLLPTPWRLLPSWFGYLSGHTLLLDHPKLINQLERWADKYQEDYELRIMGVRVIVVLNQVDMNKVFAMRPNTFHRGITPTQLHWAANEMGLMPSMFFTEGKMWSRSRRLIAPSLNTSNVMAMVPTISAMIERLCAKWSKDARAGKVVDVKDDMLRYTHDVLFHSALGVVSHSLEGKDGKPCATYEAMDSVSAAVHKLAMEPLLQLGWVCIPSLLPWARRAKHSRGVLQKAALTAINKLRREMDEGEGKGTEAAEDEWASSQFSTSDGKILRKIVSNCSAYNKAAQGGAANGKGSGEKADSATTMPDEHLVSEAIAFFMAGTGSASMLLSWIMYYFVKHPDVLARCRKEALEVAPDTKGIVYTKEQFAKLEYCSAVYMESLRLKPPGPAFLVHSKEEYEMQNGLRAGKGTAFMALTRYPTLAEDAFTRPLDFVPGRWIEAEREEALLGPRIGDEKRTVNHAAEKMFPYGAGPRECPGKDMAKAEVVALLAAVSARFDFALAPGQSDPPQEVLTVIMVPDCVKLLVTEA